MKKSKIILASTSKYRKIELERLGHPFQQVAPLIDESLWKNQNLLPEILAQTLSTAKGQSVLQHAEYGITTHDIIIASDQVCSLGDAVFSKPGNFAAAEIMLQALSGKTHLLCTAVSIFFQGNIFEYTDITQMTMNHLSAAEIKNYLLLEQPYDCAGSYKWESLGVRLFSKVTTQDPTAIMGLPLLYVQKILKEIYKETHKD